MLDDALKGQLKSLMDKIVHPVVLAISEDPSHKRNGEMVEFVNEVAGLSDKVTVKQEKNTEISPSFTMYNEQGSTGITFAGLPMGHEFSSFILALLQSSGHPPKISPEDASLIKAIQGKRHFEIFVSLSCHNCPEVVQSLNILSVLNPDISCTMIDGAMFKELADDRGVMSVPTVFLNGEEFVQGRVELDELLGMLSEDKGKAQVEELQKKEPFDVLVIGGGPAGCSSAIYSARKGLKTGIVAERFGGQIMDTKGIENYISVVETEGPALAANMKQHVQAYPVDVMNLQRVKKVTPKGEGETFHTIELESGATLKSKTIIVATGAKWRDLNVPGETEFRTKGVAYCPHCDGPIFKGKPVAVIGGGNSGVEAAIDLAGIVDHVTVVEFADKMCADKVLQKKLLSLKNVDVICSAQTTEVLGTTKVTGMKYKNRQDGTEHELKVDGIFVQIGLLPNTAFMKDIVEMTRIGEIKIDSKCRSSVKGIYAAGDCSDVPFKQIIIATGEGAKAALAAFEEIAMGK